MLNEIGSIDNVEAFVEERQGGQGHGCRASGTASTRTSTRGPRSSRRPPTTCSRSPARTRCSTSRSKLEEVALSDDYFISRKLYPNVDFYSGLIYQAMGFPIDMFTVLFAIPARVGLAGALEGAARAGPEDRPAAPAVHRCRRARLRRHGRPLSLAYRPRSPRPTRSRVSARLIDVVIELTIAGDPPRARPHGRPLAGDFLVVVAVTAYETTSSPRSVPHPASSPWGCASRTLDPQGPCRRRRVPARLRGGAVLQVLSSGRPSSFIMACPSTSRSSSAAPARLPRPHGGHGRGRPGAPLPVTPTTSAPGTPLSELPVFTVWGDAVGLDRRRGPLGEAPRPLTAAGAQRRRGGTAVTAWLHSAWALVWMCPSG